VLVRATETEPGNYLAQLPREGDYQVQAERAFLAGGFDYRTLRATLFYLETPQGPALRTLSLDKLAASKVIGVSVEGDKASLLVRMDYLWFAPFGAPPTEKNRLELLICGEEGWGAVADALDGAKQSVHVTTWIYQPTTEIRRPDPLSDPDQREPYTIHESLERAAGRGALVRLLVWDAPFVGLAREAKDAAERAGDRFEVLQQKNPTERRLLNDDEFHLLNEIIGSFPIGSYHQKTVVVDGWLGFCGGMNLCEVDWDTRAHRLFDPRRSKFSREHGFRARVQALTEKPDNKPRHDFVARVVGPAVRYLEDNFKQRWNFLLQEGGGYTENATAMPEPAACPPNPEGGSQVQVVRTMPAPWNEHGILEVYTRAISRARRYIYIEDQYFRSTIITEALASQIRKYPDLLVIVVTNQSYADDMLSGGWCRDGFERLRERDPDLNLYTLKAWARDDSGEDTVEEIDIHAKLLLVDDLFLTVGSCNVNDRGFEFEGEINVAVVDPALVKATREALFKDHLDGDPRLSGDLAADVALLREHGARNAAYLRGEQAEPISRIYAFEPRDDRKRIFGHEVF